MSGDTVASRRAAFSTLGMPGAGLADVIALARRAGITGIELRSATGESAHRGLPAAARARLRDRLVEAGITLVGLNAYVRLCAAADDGAQLDELLAQLQLAADLGAGGVRVFMRDESEDGSGERLARERIAAARETAVRLGVPILIETHDSHAQARRVADFLATLEPDSARAVGAIWDTAHTWSHGESPAQSLAALAPHLAYLQIKDHATRADAVPVPLGAGAYPIAELGAALDAADWGGWVSLEWERTWHPGLPPLAEALSVLPHWAEPVLHAARVPSVDTKEGQR